VGGGVALLEERFEGFEVDGGDLAVEELGVSGVLARKGDQ